MKLKHVNFVLTFTALIPATLLLFINIVSIFILLVQFNTKTALLLLPFTFCCFGYAGLLMNLYWSDNIKFEVFTILFLIFGIFGVSFLFFYIGDFNNLMWFLSFKLSKEWLLIAYPFWIAIILIIIRCKHLMELKK